MATLLDLGARLGVVAVAAAAAQCHRGEPMFEPSPQRHLAESLGTSLPPDATDVHFHRHQPSTDLSLHIDYAKLRTSPAEYLALTDRMGLTRYPGSAPALRARLPAAWRLVPPLTLPWWDAGPAIPDDTALRQIDRGDAGVDFVVAKYERGYVYLVQKRR